MKDLRLGCLAAFVSRLSSFISSWVAAERSKVAASVIVTLLLAGATALADEDAKQATDAKKVVAGKAEVLKDVPKKFATFLEMAPVAEPRAVAARQVKLHVEGDSAPSIWPVNADGEIKIHGWWGRAEQLHAGDRVWLWFDLDRRKQPKSVLMLADEISEQDIHNLPYTLQAVDLERGTVTVRSSADAVRTLKLSADVQARRAGDGFEFSTARADVVTRGKPGDKRFVQTAGDTARLLLDAAGLEQFRDQQKSVLRERWRKDGLPGTVSILHPLGGELELLLDHEGIRWGRYLTSGDAVSIRPAVASGFEPIQAVVKHVRPWRERTQLRLVTERSFDQAELAVGGRVQVLVPEPPAAIEASPLPTDLDRPRTKDERIEWFLATIYCSCSVAGDRCTGMFYTQASCNVNACGMPNQMRARVSELIDKQLTDKQVLDELAKQNGPLVVKQHLLR